MPGEPSETLRIARKYTVKAPQSPAVWLARLEVERAYGGEAGADKAWAEARGSSAGSPDELEAVWTWGLDGPTGAVVRSDAVLTLEVRATFFFGSSHAFLRPGSFSFARPRMSGTRGVEHVA